MRKNSAWIVAAWVAWCGVAAGQEKPSLPAGWVWDGDAVKATASAKKDFDSERQALRAQKQWLQRTLPKLPPGFGWMQGKDGEWFPYSPLGSTDPETLRKLEHAEKTLACRKQGLPDPVEEEGGIAVRLVGGISDGFGSIRAVSHAAVAVSHTAAEMVKPITGAAESISAVGQSIADAVRTVKLCLIAVVLLVALLGIGRIVKFMTK
jgi:hypothetical protein